MRCCDCHMVYLHREKMVDEYEQLLTDDIADIWGEASCYVTRYYEGCFAGLRGELSSSIA